MSENNSAKMMQTSYLTKAETLRRFSRFIVLSRENNFPISLTVDSEGTKETIYLTGDKPDQHLFEELCNWASGYAMLCEEWAENWGVMAAEGGSKRIRRKTRKGQQKK